MGVHSTVVILTASGLLFTTARRQQCSNGIAGALACARFQRAEKVVHGRYATIDDQNNPASSAGNGVGQKHSMAV